jgi:hypothetical protein
VAALLAALLIAAFHGALAGRLFYLRDVSQNHYPIRRLVTERLASHALPLWDPYHGGGTPLLANPDNLVLHPITALFAVLPFDAAFTASILLQYALLAWGGYLLVRALGVGREGATLAGAILSLAGPAASLASLQNVLSAAAWVPIGLWAFVRGLEPGRRWFLALAAGFAAVIMVPCEPASLLAFVAIGAVLGASGPDAGDGAPRRWRCLPALVGVLALGALIGAAQILPARELLALSGRGGGLAAPEAMRWSLEPARLPEVVLPRLFGDPTRLSPQAWWGGWLFDGRYPFLLSIYVGAIPVLLAALALARRGPGSGRRLALGAFAAASLLLALGRHSALYRSLWSALPAVRAIRYPERFLLAGLVALAILAALGLQQILDRTASRKAILGGLVGAAAAAFVLVTVAASAPSLADGFLEKAARVPAPILGTETGPILHGAFLRSVLWMFGETAVLALAAVAALRPDGRFAAAAGFVIAACSGLSMIGASSPALSTAASGWLKDPGPLAATVLRGPGAPRLHHDPRPDGLSIWGTTDELAWVYRFDRFTYSLGTGHADGVPTILDAATDRMDLREQTDLGRALRSLPLDNRLKVLSLAHVGFLMSYDAIEHPDLEPAAALAGFSLPPLRVYRLRSVLPRARWVGSARPPSRTGDPTHGLTEPGFDPRRSVILEEEAAAVPATGSPTAPVGGTVEGQGSAEILDEVPERLRIRVRAPAPGYLVLADAFAPGWRATRDGSPVPILRANGMFRAVAVGPGEQTIVMSYAPVSVRLGLAASAGGLLVALALGIAARRRGVA